jgi:ABC-type multidrug transport system fused ATPase/permease subunit
MNPKVNVKKFFRKYVLGTIAAPEPVKVKFSLKDMLFYARFVKPLWKVALVSLLLTLVITGVSSFTPLGGKALIDNVLLKKDPSDILSILNSLGLAWLRPLAARILGSLNMLVLAGLLFGLLTGVVSILQSFVNFRFNTGVTFRVQTELFDRVLRYPLSIFKEKQTGYLMERITGDVHAVQSFFSQYLFQFLRNILTPAISLFILFHLDPSITFLLLALVPLNVLINYLVMVRARALSYRQMEKTATISGDIQEVLSGIEVIKSYGGEEREKSKVAGKMKDVIELQLRSLLLSSFAGYLLQGINLATRLFITWMCGRRVLAGTMTVGDLTSFTLYSMQLSGQLSGIFGQIISLQYLFLSMGRLHEMFSITPEIDKERKGPPLLRPARAKGRIEFRKASFAYIPGRPVLTAISFQVAPREKIAIMGSSGIGKTTLMSLVLKFYTPQEGHILLDGLDLQELDTEWLRSQIAIVSQETFLFNDTVENNIRYGKPGAGQAEVEKAARQALIHEDILKLENGYRTLVGERGARLSIGQKQRVSLARAFLKNPAILILDEPTSALDRRTEKNLGEVLRRITQGRTTILITHRLPLVGLVDRVFEFGRKGRREELFEVRKKRGGAAVKRRPAS